MPTSESCIGFWVDKMPKTDIFLDHSAIQKLDFYSPMYLWKQMIRALGSIFHVTNQKMAPKGLRINTSEFFFEKWKTTKVGDLAFQKCQECVGPMAKYTKDYFTLKIAVYSLKFITSSWPKVLKVLSEKIEPVTNKGYFWLQSKV